MSQFEFLKPDFEELFDLACKAETNAISDPSVCCIYARKALEYAIKWMFNYDTSLELPISYDPKLAEYLKTPGFKNLRGGTVHEWADQIRRNGNKAAHDHRHRSHQESITSTQKLFAFCYWFAHTYSHTQKPPKGLYFNPHTLPNPKRDQRQNREQRQQLEAQIEKEIAEKQKAKERVKQLHLSKAELEAEIQKLKQLVKEAKKQASKKPFSDQVLNEEETRKHLIDLLLKEAGWALNDKRDREFQLQMPPGAKNKTGKADYVLWGDDDKPLAVIEAKPTKTDPYSAIQQAALYADALETQFGQRPVIFTTNGFKHYISDDAPGVASQYAPRRIESFYTKEELALMIWRRNEAKNLQELKIAAEVAGRPYQLRAIRAVTEALSKKQRTGLLVMATGSGKTRTVIALADLLTRANWVKRVLFLADRKELVRQAAQAFKSHLPDLPVVNLIDEANNDGRIYISTYPTMLNKISEQKSDRTKRFGSGFFDLVVIDEAHRSVYAKYRAIFEYFDSLLIGLTATPKDEVHKDTYSLFGLETGFPTDAYSLDEAIAEGYLVPPKGKEIGLKFMQRGIKYNDLSLEEQLKLEEDGWGDDDHDGEVDAGIVPDVKAGEMNKYLFNEDTVDKVIEQLMANGLKIAGGDVLGKTVIFAKNQKHADFIRQRFDAQYPALGGQGFAQVITHSSHSPQKAISDFKQAEKYPNIAISVDMLDTGIDVPEVLNLVLFKVVYSKTKFWQMIGRGTRLCEDIFGPGKHKSEFYVFDACANLEHFSQNLPSPDQQLQVPLSAKIFKKRVEALTTIDTAKNLGAQSPEFEILTAVIGNAEQVTNTRNELCEQLQKRIASMHQDNFLIRKHLRLVEKYSKEKAWQNPGELAADANELMADIAALPDELEPENENAKRFDLLALNIQLAMLHGSSYEGHRERVKKIAGHLEVLDNVPAIAKHQQLIIDVQSNDWWVDANYLQIEQLRRKLRDLIQLLPKEDRRIVTTDIEDELLSVKDVDLVVLDDFAEFRKRAQAWLKEHAGEQVIAKIRAGQKLTIDDEATLQQMLIAADVGGKDSFAIAAEKVGSLALFMRSLTGFDYQACQAVFQEFLNDKLYSSEQIRFVQKLIEVLTHNGVVKAQDLYEQPFTGLAPQGPEELFEGAGEDLETLFEKLQDLNEA